MILGISGKKQAGKTTAANIIYGEHLYKNQLVKDYSINKEGKLSVETSDGDGWGFFDIERKDQEFAEYAHYNIWPWVKLYNFGDELKRICVELFDIPFGCVYGTDEQKNQIQEHLLWENMPGICTRDEHPYYKTVSSQRHYVTYHEPGPMTAREFMQYFGTDVMRKIWEPVWINSCIKKIKREQSELAIIADVRFPNEVKAINEAGGKVLRLKRDPYGDSHDSETALDPENFDQSKFWRFIDNQETTISDVAQSIKKILKEIK